ncbi:MAG: hypothetical protein AUH35_02510 [Nitrospirae bacterium 13_1_40CM_62_7]|nr:MAG: hypothetical protein AUH35_02510 [Nitrospirae bacterium 13_1_40CM_62_7]
MRLLFPLLCFFTFCFFPLCCFPLFFPDFLALPVPVDLACMMDADGVSGIAGGASATVIVLKHTPMTIAVIAMDNVFIVYPPFTRL